MIVDKDHRGHLEARVMTSVRRSTRYDAVDERVADVAVDDARALGRPVPPFAIGFPVQQVRAVMADQSMREPGAGFELALIALAFVVCSAGLTVRVGAELAILVAGANGTVTGGMFDWLGVAGRLARGTSPHEAWGDARRRPARRLARSGVHHRRRPRRRGVGGWRGVGVAAGGERR